MTSLTIAVEEQVLRRARVRALESNTSVNALLRGILQRFADGEPVEALIGAPSADQARIERMKALAREIGAAPGKAKLTKPPGREEIYAERLKRSRA